MLPPAAAPMTNISTVPGRNRPMTASASTKANSPAQAISQPACCSISPGKPSISPAPIAFHRCLSRHPASKSAPPANSLGYADSITSVEPIIMTSSLQGRTLFISGASRGSGRAIALNAAADGAILALAAKPDRTQPKLPGTIDTAADQILQADGRALPPNLVIRNEVALACAMDETAHTLGGIASLGNNASA